MIRMTVRGETVCMLILLALGSPLPHCRAEENPSPKLVSRPSESSSSVADRLQEVAQELASQREVIQQQQEQIKKLARALEEGASIRAQAATAGKGETRKPADATPTSEATSRHPEQALETATSGAKSQQSSLALQMQETQKRLDDLEHPASIHYRGITLRPGGFITADVLVRTRNENADLTSNFGAAPFDGVVNSKLSEFRASSRVSRLTLLGEGMAGSTKLTGYYEIDFLGQAPTANQIETNSFTPRQRQLWAQADFSNGLTITGGQVWSLLTTHRKGIATRAEFIPNTIEASYVVGYDYIRQTAFRLTENFNDRAWAAVEIANSETNQPNASYVPPNLFGFNNSPNASSPNGSTLNYLPGSTNGFSTNLAPDVLAKIAFEPGWGHYELKALGRFFRDRINGSNNVTYGGGLGAAVVLPLIRNKADFMVEGLAGAGIGRYGAANGADVTLRPDGKIIPIHAVHSMAALEMHLSPRLDAFVYGGDEYYRRSAYLDPLGNAAGYGSPLVNNTNCGLEVVPSGGAACGAQNRNVWDATGGFWYRFYKGPYGALQYGVQYEYLHRSTWAGVGGAPQGLDSVILSSFRFLLP